MATRTKNPAPGNTVRYFTDVDGGVVIDRYTEEVQLLNKAGIALFQLCDGTRNKREIEQALVGKNFKDPARRASIKWMEKAIKSGLLEYGTSKAKAKSATPAQLRKIAENLYEADNVKAAYRLQRKLVELKPDNADDWYQFGEVAHAMGYYDVSREAYLQYLEDHPDDEEIKHLVVALDGGKTPGRMPDSSVVQIFDGFADSFDAVLVDELGYKAPKLVARALKKYLPKKANALNIADLGCGTGLAGREIEKITAHLCGVDLSAKMLARACETGLYHELHVAELLEWLKRRSDKYDAIIAADVFVYFGELNHLFECVSQRMTAAAPFVFTVEKSVECGCNLTVSGRYSHHKDYIRETAEAAGLKVQKISQVTLRVEYGEDVKGYVVVLTHP